jgi:hypothetical protein
MKSCPPDSTHPDGLEPVDESRERQYIKARRFPLESHRFKTIPVLPFPLRSHQYKCLRWRGVHRSRPARNAVPRCWTDRWSAYYSSVQSPAWAPPASGKGEPVTADHHDLTTDLSTESPSSEGLSRVCTSARRPPALLPPVTLMHHAPAKTLHHSFPIRGTRRGRHKPVSSWLTAHRAEARRKNTFDAGNHINTTAERAPRRRAGGIPAGASRRRHLMQPQTP